MLRVNFDEYFALKSHDYTLFQASNQNTSQADSPLAGFNSRISAKAVIGPEARLERQPNTPGFIHCIVILIFFFNCNFSRRMIYCIPFKKYCFYKTFIFYLLCLRVNDVITHLQQEDFILRNMSIGMTE